MNVQEFVMVTYSQLTLTKHADTQCHQDLQLQCKGTMQNILKSGLSIYQDFCVPQFFSK